MGLHLTPAILEASYELLRVSLPFRRWGLPHADDVEFHVTRHKDRDGDCTDGDTYTIRISAERHSTLARVLETMAHEMCHMRDITHGSLFQRLAKQVCKHHGFDPKTF
jgi:uncharacterized protein YbaP (TraB family)